MIVMVVIGVLFLLFDVNEVMLKVVYKMMVKIMDRVGRCWVIICSGSVLCDELFF